MSSSSLRNGIELRDSLPLIVSEIFGPTVQGEGPTLGMPTMFLRLGICNLTCSWCDTKYTWDWANYDYTKETKRMTAMEVVDEIIDQARESPEIHRLVISGGEPLLQQEKLLPIVSELGNLQSWQIEVETAGTIVPNRPLQAWVSNFNVSPKLSHSGNSFEKRFNKEALGTLLNTSKAVFKFVVQTIEDLDEVKWIVNEVKIPKKLVYVMPEGSDLETISNTSKDLVDYVVKEGYNMTTRLHVLIWGNKRGV